jgi:hypothetical protein
MDTKPIKPKRASVYSPEELEPRDHAADEAWADAWIERNREQIDRDVAQARRSLADGKGKTFSKPGQLTAYIMRRVERRLGKKPKTK